MKRTYALLSLSALTAAFFVACGGETPAPKGPSPAVSSAPAAASTPEAKKEEPPPPPPKKEEPPPPPPKKKASELIVPGSTWMFSLADSPDAKKAAEEGCAKKAGKDDKKKEACMKDAEAAAAGEGWRIEKDDKGKMWWVSFGMEKGKEVVYNKIMSTISKDTEVPGKLAFKPEGKDMGKKPFAKLPESVEADMPDESTVSMQDPKKGKLVFKLKKLERRPPTEPPRAPPARGGSSFCEPQKKPTPASHS